MKKLMISAFFIAAGVVSANAQIAQGGTYKLDQAVIAGGGTSADSTGNAYTLDGIIGEPIAGTTSSSSTYVVKGGFLTSNGYAPTAATVTISGRVLNLGRGGLMNARVTLTDLSGNAKTVATGKLGTFCFTDVEVGNSYIISVSSRHYSFQPQFVSVMENLINVNFTAQEATDLK